MIRRLVVSGCSGGGKSSLIGALAALGFATVAEPGRRILRDGGPMPWIDAEGFARRAVAMALADWEASAARDGPVFFDRGLVDAVVALAHATGVAAPLTAGLAACYDPIVFLAPPWPEIFATEPERRHGFSQAEAEYRRLSDAYRALGYRVFELPRLPISTRVTFVTTVCGLGTQEPRRGDRRGSELS